MGEISLNFVPLKEQFSKFKVYRKKVEDSSMQKVEGDYRTKLPLDENDDNYVLYDIRLTQADGYEEFECHYETNVRLSEYYLFFSVKKLVENNDISFDCPVEFSIDKYKEISFTLKQHTKGKTQIVVSPYYLSSNSELGIIVEHKFKKNEAAAFDREVLKLSKTLSSDGRQNTYYYRDVRNIITEFLEEHLVKALKNTEVSLKNELSQVHSKELDTKTYLVADNKEANSQFAGIKRYGPFDSVEDDVKYIFVFSEKTRSLARDIYMGLMGKLYPGQFSGLKEMFGLDFDKSNVTHKVLSAFDQDNIEQLKADIERINDESPDAKVMLVVVLPYGFKGNDSAFDAYGYLKLFSLRHNVVCQFTTEDTFTRKEDLKWSISNIGLQIFSKLGGTPWLVKPAKNDCLILGIGSAHEYEGDELKKYVAYTVCLDSSGKFRYIKPLSSSEDRTEYLDSLSVCLKGILEDEIDQTYNSFVLHIPYKIKKDEIKAIQSMVKEIHQKRGAEFVVVKINTKHRFFGFSEHNTCVPYESTLVSLSSGQYLLWAEGLLYGKEVLHKRVSEPLLIDFIGNYHNDTKVDCLQDVLNLTGANWRGFNSKAQPISILYSRLIAKFMKDFSHFDEFNDIKVLHAEATAPWFL